MPRSLAAAIGRTPTEGELYIAHFLGSDGAAKLIGARRQPAERQCRGACFRRRRRPTAPSSTTRAGQPRSVGEVYAKLTGRFEARARRRRSRRPCAARTEPPRAGRRDTAGVTAGLRASRRVPPRYRCRRSCRRQQAAVPVDVHRSRRPGGGADRQQSVDAGQTEATPPATARRRRCSTCSPTRRARRASRSGGKV